MKIDVLFSPAGLTPPEVAGRPVFVIDVLRASTVICAALHHGARGVVPVATPEEAARMAQSLGPDDVVTAGERNSEPIPGFALGNSPLEMTELAVRGKTLVMTTTNGTRAILAAQGAAEVYLAGAVNLTVAGARARDLLHRHKDLLILCGGKESRFGLDDAYAAGRLVMAALEGRRRRRGLNDGALAAVDLVRRYGENWERPLMHSAAGRQLVALGMGTDVADAARENAYPVLPVFHDRRITVAAAESPPAATSSPPPPTPLAPAPSE
ncbi:MAG TPA: 2-phosphosulfolactate phosphatase [Gemmatimonadales bacterium]|jgi:2-phosphosulfolactate phosphatase|nr:2-phosphosulfolactate phosphatase [Gemmatimonadales bacterium]